MSRSSVRKQVLIETLQDNDSTLTDNQKIVRILKSRGNNLHEVEAPDGCVVLVSMPKKFRGGIWLKKGDFVVVEPIAEGNKVKAEIVKILSLDQIKYYKKNSIWPKEFSNDIKEKEKEDEESDDSICLNPNRPIPMVGGTRDDTSSDSDSSSNPDEEDHGRPS